MIMLNYYIHSNGLAHLDIKPENYMIEKNNILHLIDFGLSKCLTKSKLCDSESKLVNKSTQFVYNESINQVFGTPAFVGLSMASLRDKHLTSYIDDYYTISIIILSLYNYKIAERINRFFNAGNMKNKEEELHI